MVKKKRVTLPKEFEALIAENNVEALKALYERCELHAVYTGGFHDTALHHYGVPYELVSWLVDQGLDVDVVNDYGYTALHKHATVGHDKMVELLLQLGARIEKADSSKRRALHAAAGGHHSSTVKLLLEKGAKCTAKNKDRQTPLAYALEQCYNAHITDMAEIATMLLDAGDVVTPKMQEYVENIGKNFELYRDSFNPDFLEDTDSALNKLYTLFQVSPVKRRVIHDGKSAIDVPEGSWQDQHQALWEMLVPANGAADTIQGEVIRITGRVADEMMRNGGVNWDAQYRKMVNALPVYFASGGSLCEQMLEETKVLVSKVYVNRDFDEDVLDRLCELAVEWVKANPTPIPLGNIGYKR